MRSATLDGQVVEQIRRGINRSGLSVPVIEARLGVAQGYIWNALAGKFRISHPVAVRLSDILVWPRIAELSLAARMSSCALCGAAFLIAGAATNRRFCTSACKEVARKRVTRGTSERAMVVTRHRLLDHQDAVAAHCAWCSPDGLCNDSACALRPVSPFPLTRLLPVLMMPLQGRPSKRQDRVV